MACLQKAWDALILPVRQNTVQPSSHRSLEKILTLGPCSVVTIRPSLPSQCGNTGLSTLLILLSMALTTASGCFGFPVGFLCGLLSQSWQGFPHSHNFSHCRPLCYQNGYEKKRFVSFLSLLLSYWYNWEGQRVPSESDWVTKDHISFPGTWNEGAQWAFEGNGNRRGLCLGNLSSQQVPPLSSSPKSERPGQQAMPTSCQDLVWLCLPLQYVPFCDWWSQVWGWGSVHFSSFTWQGH